MRRWAFALAAGFAACSQANSGTTPAGAGGADPGAGGTAGVAGAEPRTSGGADTNAGSGGAEVAGESGAAGSPELGRPPSAPTGLLCDLLRHPELTELTDAAPRFGYVIAAKHQSAFQILVASSRERISANTGDIWDSGRQASAQSIDLAYQGPALKAGATYFWKVRIWDEQNAVSAWSEAQQLKLASKLDAYGTAREPVVGDTVAPAKLTTLAQDHVFVDFGRDAFGWLELTFDAKKAGSMTVRLGERATGNAVSTSPGGSVRSASVTLALTPGLKTYRVETPKNTQNTSAPAIALPADLGVVMPFRYVEVLGAPVALTASMFEQAALHYPSDAKASAFESSNGDLNQIWELSKYSIIAPTFAGIYLDGDRERRPYEGDAYIQQLGHYATDREFALARYSHEYLLTHPTWPTEWKQHSVMMAWTDWMYTGNTQALAHAYDTLVAEKTLESHVRADGLLNSSGLQDLVDWPDGERDGYVFTAVNTVVNAFFCRNMQQMADIARVLGKTADAARYDAMADTAIGAFNAQLLDPKTGVYVDGVGTAHSSLHANMLPLAFGLVPSANVAAVAALVKSRGMACSVYGAQYLLEALFQVNEADAAFGLITADSKRSWLNMLHLGATITLEAWDAQYKPNLDWNHAWGAAPANIIPRFVLGVSPSAPGFAHAAIKPHPGSLTHFAGTVPTIRGAIQVTWNHASGKSPTLTVVIPGNMQADVAVPAELRSLCQPLLDNLAARSETRDGSVWFDDLETGAHELSCPPSG